MILQALKEYYDRKADLPRKGFADKEIPFILTLKDDGTLVSLSSTYEGTGKNRRAKKFLVPQTVKRTVGVASNLLWDNLEYALGIPVEKKDKVSSPKRVEEQHAAFIAKIEELQIDDAGISAIKLFLKTDNKKQLLEAFSDVWKEAFETAGANITFQLAGDAFPIFSRPTVQKVIAANAAFTEDALRSICLIAGELDSISRLHPSIKGVWGAQSAGANIVSFNAKAFESFGKDQGNNSPVGEMVAFAYTTALNSLLAKDSTQRMQIGDASTVFWSAKDSDFEKQFSDFFNEPAKDDPDRQTGAVRSLFSSVHNGAFLKDDGQSQFYVLGLSPNAARISVRFWIVGTIAEMSARICQHFEDLRIIHGTKETEFLSLFRLLVSTATQGKSENIPPNIAGETMRSILEGLPYPQTLLQATVRRIRAERDISYPRASLIKACINRYQRFYPNHQPQEKELTVSLDKENTNIGYRLGRLFAALEKIQQEANPGINATIRDRFYSSASASPVTAFGNLMRGKNHHLAKLESAGRRVNLERLLGEIMFGIPSSGYPAHLNLDDQGRFAIGYYHQMQDFYTSGKNKLADKETGEPTGEPL